MGVQKGIERGRRAYFAVKHDDNDPLTNISDMICDLMHYSDTIVEEGFEEGNNGLDVSGRAEMHYRGELEEFDAGRAFDLAEARFHGEDDIEIAGSVEKAEDGWWVQARVWIPAEEVAAIEDGVPALTSVGQAWAEREAPHSIVARVALGRENWPEQFLALAIKLANAEGDGNKLTIEERTLLLEVD